MHKVVRNTFVKTVLFSVPLALLMGGGLATADSVDYIVNVAPSFNITLSANNVTLDLNPNTKTSDAKDLNIKVSTNNMTGYYLTMSSTGDATDLVRDNTADGKNAVIPTLSAAAGTTAASLTDNTWGYKQGSGNFIPYVSGVKLLENKYATNEDETTLSFASKINYSQAAGSYELDLTLTGVANPMMNYMQNLDPSLCTTTPQTVLDSRDNKEYTIARLADGQCWMTSNLNLAGGTTLNADTSDVPTDGYYTLPASSTTGFDDDTKAFVYNSGNETTNQADCTDTQPCNSYYSWLAATAGGKDASGVDVTSDGYNAAYSICPKGWRLPTATTSNAPAQTSPNWKTGDFYKLATAYGVDLESSYRKSYPYTVLYDNAGPGTLPNFLLPGNYYNNYFQETSTYGGRYWSSSSAYLNGDYPSAYAFFLKPSSMDSARKEYNRCGFSVRCVLDDARTLSDITYMQDMNPQIMANTANSATATLTDLRDGQKYTVAKINGKVWMTRNLAIGCNGSGSTFGSNMVSKTLTSNLSDFTSRASFNTPTESLTLGNDNTNPRMECSSEYGAWYNYPTTTVETIVGSSSTEATESICPKGWKIPSYTEASTIAGNATYTTLFNPSVGSNYAGGSIDPRVRGIWWESTAYNASQRRYLYREVGQNNNNIRADGTDAIFGFGFYLRCIAR